MGACLSDGDCEPGTYCEVMCSDCDPDDEMCESICFGECVDDRMIEPECVVDEDCGPDAHCGVVAVSGCAAPSCPEGESCESMPCEEEMFYGCIDDPVSECMTNADCGEGFECASVGGVSNGMACGSDDDCLDAVPMPTEEFYACVPAECQTNEDCGPGLECLDFGWSVCPAIACADDDCPDVECEEVTEAYCAPAYIGGCEIAADCGEGFNCIAEEICECSGSGAVPPDGDREDAAPEMPWEDECTCSPSEDYYCEPIEAACLVDADCIEGWSCDQGMVSEPVLPGGPDGEDSVPAPQPDPVDPGMIDGVCVPPYGEFWTPDRNGGGYDEATESTTGHTDTNVEVPATPSVDDPSTDPTRPESEDGGCQVTPARAPLGALLGGLFGLVALRRRRR